MKEFKGQTLSWQIVNGAIELALHRDPCNEIGSLTLEELELTDDHFDTLVVARRGAKCLACFLPVHRNVELSCHAYLVESRLDHSRYVFGICHGVSLVIDGTDVRSAM